MNGKRRRWYQMLALIVSLVAIALLRAPVSLAQPPSRRAAPRTTPVSYWRGLPHQGEVTIMGTVFQDWDQDGERDDEEPTLGQAVIRLADEKGHPLRSCVTAADGGYRFDHLQPGVYRVTEKDPFGYSSIADGEVTVTLGAGDTKVVNFADNLFLQGASMDSIGH